MIFTKATFWATLVLALVSISHFSHPYCYTNAKEIVATSEWQLVEEGDSIPKGLHVRMDLETGEKWVKLLNEEEEKTTVSSSSEVNIQTATATGGLISIDDGNKDEENPSSTSTSRHEEAVKITQLANAQLSADASAKITAQLLEQSNKKKNMEDIIASLDDFEGDLSKDELEYEMMYRTLKSLPSEELNSIEGGLPSHPTEDASDEEKQMFEERIRDIWTMRQNLLKKMEEEYMADVTDVIAERIESMKEYLTDPMAQVRQIMTLRNANGGDEQDKSLKDLSNIVYVLKDLEFQLTDLDNARDFHSMGGWPLLVALLTDSIHGLEYELQQAITKEVEHTKTTNSTSDDGGDGRISIQLSDDTRKFLEKYQQIVWEIQGLACWSIGTAVKNVDEFHSWALDDFSDLVKASETQAQVNVLSILLDKLDSESSHSPSILNLSPVDQSLQMRRKYEMYALGALLRGNRDAIHFFVGYDGPAVVYKMFNYLTSDGNDLSALDSTTVKLVSKIVLLADDLVMDVTLNKNEDDEALEDDSDRQVLSSLTTFEWCVASLRMMKYPSVHIQRKMVESMIHMAPYCSFDMEGSHLLDEVTSALSIAEDGTIEDEELRDLLNKLGKIL